MRHLIQTSVVGATLALLTPLQAQLDLTTADISEIQDAVADGSLTYEDLCERFLERIVAYELNGPSIHSVISINPHWRQEAKALDEERQTSGPRGPLHGIPIAVKDNVDTVGIPNSGGAIGLERNYAPNDAFVIEQLKKGGAIIFLKTNLSEFASGSRGLPGASTLGGQPRNPYNLRRHSDGSSSGTGSALAAVFAVSGLGTETGSSVRGPSSANNLVGLAPTEGLISRDGVIPLSPTLDRVGVMARHVYDVAATLNYTTGVDDKDQVTARSEGKLPPQPYESYLDESSLDGARLGVVNELFEEDDPTCAEAIAIVKKAIADCESIGATLVPVSTGYDDLMEQLSLSNITPTEIGPALEDYFASLDASSGIQSLEDFYDTGGFIIGKWERYEEALTSEPDFDAPGYKEHLARRSEMRARLLGLLNDNDLDALVYIHNNYPSEYVNQPSTYTKVRLSSVSGLPAIVVPAGITSHGQPVAVEFLGRAFDEATLLSLAYSYEQATGHRILPPNTPTLPTDYVSK
ncbi:amidase family protein [Pelagicoccus sp. SDUM812003]|uniref:amidase n=1 Tax=Pelagicoccus sp. SDUM812003 TaxID=3041267 RepID=UPI00280E3F8F|nr:amidase family protein [Pelagicoccus sp. SDUM812003]MDQ8204689.1 amidase family protein [Pelagicoccus sp. SDUM812003]